MTPEALPSRCWVEVDLGALERNVGRIRAALPSEIGYLAVVKADAYGHGLLPLASRLMQGGADGFAVATIEEAVALRETGRGWPILVLSPVPAGDEGALLDYDLIGTLSSERETARWSALSASRRRAVRAHLKIDTGMGRLGVWHEETERLRSIVATPGLSIEGAYTHFASADTDPALTALQRERFAAALSASGLPLVRRVIHADNSAGLDSFDPHGPFNAVRIGLRQFGLAPEPIPRNGREPLPQSDDFEHEMPAAATPMDGGAELLADLGQPIDGGQRSAASCLLPGLTTEPVLSWHARIGLVKQLPAGVGIGYSQTTHLRRPSVVAVLPVGYADGLPLAASGRGEVLLHGQRCPILGRVTMDQVMIDATDIAARRSVSEGDVVTLIGQQGDASITVNQWGRWAQTIPWALLCGISRRVPRIYRQQRC